MNCGYHMNHYRMSAETDWSQPLNWFWLWQSYIFLKKCIRTHEVCQFYMFFETCKQLNCNKHSNWRFYVFWFFFRLLPQFVMCALIDGCWTCVFVACVASLMPYLPFPCILILHCCACEGEQVMKLQSKGEKNLHTIHDNAKVRKMIDDDLDETGVFAENEPEQSKVNIKSHKVAPIAVCIISVGRMGEKLKTPAFTFCSLKQVNTNK